MADKKISEKRQEMIKQIEWYCENINGLSEPEGFPDKMTDEEMQKWIEVWDEFDPIPELNH